MESKGKVRFHKVLVFLFMILLMAGYIAVSESTLLSRSATISSGGIIRNTKTTQAILSFEAFDVEMAGELQILINDVVVITIPQVDTPGWNEVWVSIPFEFNITDYCQPTNNVIKFHNPLDTGYSRIRNVNVTKDGVQILFDPTANTIVGDPFTPTDASYGPFNIDDDPPPPPPPLPTNASTWYGVGEFYLLSSYGGREGVSVGDYIGRWTDLLDNHVIPKWKFNVIRLCFTFANLDLNPLGWGEPCEVPYNNDNYAALDNVLALFQERGIKAVLCDFSYANFGSQAWLDEWKALVNHVVNSPYSDVVVAYELRNEASSWSYEQGLWWNGLYMPSRDSPPSGWEWWEMVTAAYAACTDAVREIDPDRTVVWSDPAAYYKSQVPSQDIRPNVHYAFHHWSPYNDLTQAEDYAQVEINRMTSWMNEYGPVWMGEFGSWTGQDQGYGPLTAESQLAALLPIINWCVANNVGFSLHYYQHWNLIDEYDSILAESDYATFIS